ncbi:MAG: thiamine/thiamine pyrophosphate ABC transporter permease ThiP [Rhodobacteraceae bacterium]|nr:thiamine/thiamine pyrophosphate ABC transporter permease ThiP [Paracoccaceae bacterium]MCF8513307.1 thiamine/thiamine pyrophosphate ABC transporter permease ThiP [Paracoccaceae bacterium]MCF8517793.1 thiamine/thiamine pyrophosphate ABC transporter permease ThiP [Paracoccaceae bacterium]
MARSAVSITGFGVAALVVALTLLPLGAVFLRAGGWPAFGPGDWQAVVFTLQQALLSAIISCGLAVPVARALARRRFWGRRALIVLMGAPFVLPVIVAVLGLVAVFGRAGVVNDALALGGWAPWSIYGAQGVVLAHVFLNLPLAVRMVLLGWQSIPAERLRLGESLGFGPRQVFLHLEGPMLRAVLPGAFVVIFVICLTSFAVALTLGGGPKATTVELAIYQAVRFDFDLGRAGLLAAVQFCLCLSAAGVAWALVRPTPFGAGVDRAMAMNAPGGWRLWGDGLAIGGAALFLLVPLAAVGLRGVPGLAELPGSVWAALGRSLGIALLSMGCAVLAALALSVAVARGVRWAGALDAVALLPLATSGLVLGVGLFVIVQPFVAPARMALAVTIAVNAAMSLPFVYRLLLPEAQAVLADYGRLAQSLGLRGWALWRFLILPRLARPLGFGAGLSAALSMGDLGVIALFAGDRGATLPLVVQRLMGAYRMEQAMGAALLLVAASFALFWAFDAWGRRYAST